MNETKHDTPPGRRRIVQQTPRRMLMFSQTRRATLLSALLLIASAMLLPAARIGIAAEGSPAVQAPNYELAAQWTTRKIDKAVFDLGVTPHWLETSDRFWYSYETRDGKRFWSVDPGGKWKAAPLENPGMGARRQGGSAGRRGRALSPAQ